MAENREKTYVADVDRSIYDIRDAEHDAYRMESGLTPEIVDKLSKEKGDPVWMQQFRLQSLQIYNELRLPDWGPSLEGLDIDHIATYVRPNTKMQNDWANVPQDIKDTFERLGIPQAERKSLAGVGAQYDSELVYHNVRDEVAAEGVVYTDMESALKGEYADMVRKYFMKLVTPRDHKFAALHGAVWSGGSFVYVPKGVKVEIGTEEASVDLYVVMEYGTPIQKAAYDAQESVRKAIETMTNLHVVRVDVHVQGVSFEKENNALNAGAKKALAEDKKETPLVEAPESEEKAAEDSAEVPEEEGEEN